MPKTSRKSLKPVYEIIFELSKLFGGRCEVCDKKMRGPTPGFTIHHLVYRDDEKTHKQFLDRYKYYQYLAPIVYLANDLGLLTQCFALLCNACHNSLDGIKGLTRRKDINVLRLFLMWYRTNT